MPARPRRAPATIEVTFRTYALPTAVRAAIKVARQHRKQTLRDFCDEAIRGELPGLLQAVDELGIGRPAGPRSPARIPLTDELIDELRRGSHKSGIPAAVLFRCCLQRSAARKRRRNLGSHRPAGKTQ